MIINEKIIALRWAIKLKIQNSTIKHASKKYPVEENIGQDRKFQKQNNLLKKQHHESSTIPLHVRRPLHLLQNLSQQI